MSEDFTIPQAQDEFLNIVRRLNKTDDLKQFFDWIQWNWQNDFSQLTNDGAEEMLDAIAADLRSVLPAEAILPSETIRPPAIGKNSDCALEHTIHVDAFLYDNDLVDVLCDEGKLARSYCSQCGSRDTKPLTYISHSLSRERLAYIFKSMLPPLDNRVLLDIGSRLGAALYGAYVYTRTAKVVGVEINRDLCSIQNNIISKYKLQDRIEVVEADIASRRDLVLTADIVIMNNVFEFFMDTEQQVATWRFLRQAMKSGTLLVAIPPLEESLSCLQVMLKSWLSQSS